jgi:hypothetical protein
MYSNYGYMGIECVIAFNHDTDIAAITPNNRNTEELKYARGGLRTHDLRITQVRDLGMVSGMRWYTTHGLVTL